MQTLSKSQRRLLERATLEYGENLHLALEYLEERGIGKASASTAGLGVVVDPLPGHEYLRGRLAIPYLTDSGPVNMNFRCMQDHNCKDHNHQKYMTWRGLEPNLYNVRIVGSAPLWIAISEGEVDALSSTLAGVPCVGVPGATKWQPHWGRVFEDFERVYVWQDGDEAGKRFADMVLSEVPSAVRVPLPSGSDVNSEWVTEGAQGLKNRIKQ